MASTTAYSGEDFHKAGRGVMYCFFGLVVQTFFFGAWYLGIPQEGCADTILCAQESIPF
jgi:hypothetical protein